MRRSSSGAAGVRTIGFEDGALTAFGRLRVAQSANIFDSQQFYGDNTLAWDTQLSGGAAIAHVPNESSINMQTASVVSGAKAVRQTRQKFRYQPGRGQHVVCTFVFPTPTTNVRCRVGYFDSNNGVYLQQSGSTVSIVLRTYTSGSVVETVVNQANWSEDVLDGTGQSNLTLDLTKIQILDIDMQWLGAGRLRIDFNINGRSVPVHEFVAANVKSLVYMTTANLPIRYEIENIGTAGAIATLKHVCAMVDSDGGQDLSRSQSNGFSNGITGRSVGTGGLPVLSIRARTVMGSGSIRNDGLILPVDYAWMVASQPVQYALILNGTLTGASWSAVDGSYSIADGDASATSITGGRVVAVGYAQDGGGTARYITRADMLQNMVLVYGSLLNGQDTLTMWARSTTGTATVYACMNWQEVAW